MFKTELTSLFCSKRYTFLSRGTQLRCKLLTQIRVGRSFLNSHSYTVGMSESLACICHSTIESYSHFFNECFLYNEERRTLFSTFEQYLPKFIGFSKVKKLETILYGIDVDNSEMFSTNVSLQLATQKFILQTKRFDK